MSKTKKDYILKGIQEMNISMLEIVLNEEKTYMGAQKEFFIEKLEEVFNIMKEAGDTYLYRHKGFCKGCDCPNYGCEGYSFNGNKSRYNLEFLVDETKHEVENIRSCSYFEVEDEDVKIDFTLRVDIMEDERVDFNRSPGYLLLAQRYRLAYEELYQYKEVIIGKEIYGKWLKKHKALFEPLSMFSPSYRHRSLFFTLYKEFHKLNRFLSFSDRATQAIYDFSKLDLEKESELLRWLKNYEKEGSALVMFLYIDFDHRDPFKKTYFTVEGVKVKISDFIDVIRFYDLFGSYYWDLLDEDHTLRIEED